MTSANRAYLEDNVFPSLLPAIAELLAHVKSLHDGTTFLPSPHPVSTEHHPLTVDESFKESAGDARTPVRSTRRVLVALDNVFFHSINGHQCSVEY